MEYVIWILFALLWVVAFAGLVYPIIPSVLFIAGSYLVYGLYAGWHEFTWLFIVIQVVLLAAIFIADYAIPLFGMEKFGGSSAAGKGSVVGLIVGPFVIPVVGIILGPMLGAFIAELLIEKKDVKQSFKASVGALVSLLCSAVVKGILQAIMLGHFLWQVLA